MLPSHWQSLSLLVFLADIVLALLPDGRLHGNMRPLPGFPLLDIQDDTLLNNTYNTTYYFDQLIDHENPSLGTFKQRYWTSSEYYSKGGPIVLATPGETNADGYYVYLSNISIFGLIAQQERGCTIILEHRFYGLSKPYPELTEENLRVHTIQQAIDDLVYFAQNVRLPMPNGDNIGPDKAPWILAGGSYSAALTSWTMINKPGIFWAGYASSAVVEAITDFWLYWEPIRKFMPANCSADVYAVIQHIDAVFQSNNETAIQTIKDAFGMAELSHLDDVAGALRNNLWTWQQLQSSTGPNAAFFQFCDALEVTRDGNVSVRGWGLDHALAAWGSYFKDIFLGELCGDLGIEVCLGTYSINSSSWADSDALAWMWVQCNEAGFFQDGPPKGTSSIVTRLVQPEYDQRQCRLLFPEAFKSTPTPDTRRINQLYQGWDVKVNRLFFANGLRDPWRDATVSADGLQTASTHLQTIGVDDGFHCSNLFAKNAVDPSVAAVQKQALIYMKKWLAEWQPPR